MHAGSILKSMRLRTLPLSLSGTIIGIGMASTFHIVEIPVAAFVALTTALLQILSNLSNELGDTLHGTDTEERQGIHYSIQDGEMSIAQMKKLIGVILALCILSGLVMIWLAFGTLWAPRPAVFCLLGAAAIWAAMHYTLGKNPYGYRGLGDIFVFIFFGLVSACGSYFLCCVSSDFQNIVLPACGIGFFSVGVLNVNNIRDMKSDAATRSTIALKLGLKKARQYHIMLLCAGWFCLAVHTAIFGTSWSSWLYVFTLPIYVIHAKGVCTRTERALDPMLPMLVMSTFLLSILFALFA